MESYHKRKRDLSSKYDKLINISLQPIPNRIEASGVVDPTERGAAPFVTYKKDRY